MELLLISSGLLFVYTYAVSFLRKDTGVADIACVWGFAFLAWSTYLLGTMSLVSFVLSLLVTIWALRLSLRIYLCNRGKTEDIRCTEWRREWGNNFSLRNLSRGYLIQGLIIFVFVLPVSLVSVYGSDMGIGVLGLVGLGMWGIGFLFEIIGDVQLEIAVRNPSTKGSGTASHFLVFARPPQYFGEPLIWLGIALMAFDTLVLTLGIPYVFLPFAGPLLITAFLLRVSGVPLLKARFEGSTKWKTYKARTSVFLSLLPRNKL